MFRIIVYELDCRGILREPHSSVGMYLKGNHVRKTCSCQLRGSMLLLILMLEMRGGQSSLQIKHYICSSEGQQQSRSGLHWCNWGVIGTAGIKAQIVELRRPQCRLNGLREEQNSRGIQVTANFRCLLSLMEPQMKSKC